MTLFSFSIDITVIDVEIKYIIVAFQLKILPTPQPGRCSGMCTHRKTDRTSGRQEKKRHCGIGEGKTCKWTGRHVAK